MPAGQTGRAGNLATIAVVTVAIIITAAIAPVGVQMRDAARNSEAKTGLHRIQLSTERYAVDNQGVYPAYLIGGDARGRIQQPAPGDPHSYSHPAKADRRSQPSDPLLREGYLTAYPSNPFDRHGTAALAMQEDLPTSITGDDPLRPGSAEGDRLGYRFGAKGSRTGSVLCDPRCEKWTCTDPQTGEAEEHDTWAIIEYQFWDMWAEKEPKQWLPGAFFYKSVGPVVAGNTRDSGLVLSPLPQYQAPRAPFKVPPANKHLSLDGMPVRPPPMWEADQYVMGVYGGQRSRGQDYLGEEQPLSRQSPSEQNDDLLQHPLAWAYTRSQYSSSLKNGCPFHIDLTEDFFTMGYGNPNGISDSIILFLTAGEFYVSDD